ncbi:MAG: radical SAM protein [bacterium]|nr:radical SAM protein [bacterium]
MANFFQNKISIAYDIYGCPQLCKHCWLGHFKKHPNMDVNETIANFLKIKEEQTKHKYFNIQVEYFSPDFREPHYGDDYKLLSEKTNIINGCNIEIEKKFELLSIWRLTRDPEYVKWVREKGIKRCQIKIFGLKETNNFFYGRNNAHKDIIDGTSILLDNGIIPRWQIYYNKKGINELEDILDLTNKLNIWDRVSELGEKFNIHGLTYDSDGRGFKYHNFRIDENDIEKIPMLLIEKSREHFGNNFRLSTERELLKEINENNAQSVMPKEHWLWFFVTSDWNVYPNIMGVAPWWLLGNTKHDSWETILSNYAYDKNIGLKIMNNMTVSELANRYGNKTGNKIYSNKSELITYLVGKHCRELYYKNHTATPEAEKP